MAQPIIIQEGIFCKYLTALQGAMRPSQWKYFVTVQMGLVHCQASRTLSGILRSVATWVTVWQLSRFLVSPRWTTEKLAEERYRVYTAEVQPLVAAAHAEQRRQRVKRRGRYRATVVTGYLILDDSTHVKRYAQKMGGQGQHYSSIDKCTMPGHSLFQGLYLVEGRQYPLDPQMYIQKAVCEADQRPFCSKVDLALEVVTTFSPLPETQTHVLVDSWYVSKRMWKTVKQRHWDLTGGLKRNRKLRIVNAEGIREWMRIDDFADELSAKQFQAVAWPSQEGERTVYAHLQRTHIKKLGVCQILVVKPSADAPVEQARFFVTTRLPDTLEQVVHAVALRWAVETLFSDFKELMGSDHYQLRSAEAIRRFWALGLCLYQFLDGLRHRLQRLQQQHVTLGETLHWLREQQHQRMIDWVCSLSAKGVPSLIIQQELAPALPALSLANC
jgi:hypothetical protein